MKTKNGTFCFLFRWYSSTCSNIRSNARCRSLFRYKFEVKCVILRLGILVFFEFLTVIVGPSLRVTKTIVAKANNSKLWFWSVLIDFVSLLTFFSSYSMAILSLASVAQESSSSRHSLNTACTSTTVIIIVVVVVVITITLLPPPVFHGRGPSVRMRSSCTVRRVPDIRSVTKHNSGAAARLKKCYVAAN